MTSRFPHHNYPWKILKTILGGLSVIDLPKLHIKNIEEATQFIKAYGYDPSSKDDVELLWDTFYEAIRFIEESLQDAQYPRVPQHLRNRSHLQDIRRLLILASLPMKNPDRLWSCSILRVIHVLIHLNHDPRRVTHDTAQTQIMSRLDQFIHESPGGDITLFNQKTKEEIKLLHFKRKKQKNKDREIIKVLHKNDASPELIYDRLGIRFVTESKIEALNLLKVLIDDNIVNTANFRPSRSKNTLIDVKKLRDEIAKILKTKKREINSFEELSLTQLENRITPSQGSYLSRNFNPHTSQSYSSIQFTCKELVRIPTQNHETFEKLNKVLKDHEERESLVKKLFPSTPSAYQHFFYPYEIQIMDLKAYSDSLFGKSNHFEYRKKQLLAATNRVLGVREATLIALSHQLNMQIQLSDFQVYNVTMSEALDNSKHYYLGIDGEQKGPFSTDQIQTMVKNNQIPPETLLWYEGLDDWIALDTTEFDTSPKTDQTTLDEIMPPPSEASEMTSTEVEIQEQKTTTHHATFSENLGEPLFNKQEALFRKKFNWLTHPLTLFTTIAIAGISGYLLLLKPKPSNTASKRPTKKRVSLPKGREAQLRQALSEMIIKPKKTIPILLKLIKDNSNDSVGSEALKNVVDYYRRNRKQSQAADLLMSTKRYEEAGDLYLVSPARYKKAEEALYQAFKHETNKEKQKILLEKSINLLLGPLSSRKKSLEKVQERITLFSKKFPDSKNPFAYYLMQSEAKIQDLFSRLKPYFLETLTKYIESDFPDIELLESPELFLKKNTNFWNIMASYQGDIIFGSGSLNNITLNFKKANNRWYLIETNLTPERQQWSRQIKTDLEKKQLAQKETLEYLENVFKARFPKRNLHETIP